MHMLRSWHWLIALALLIANGAFATIVFFDNMTIHFDASSNNVKAYRFDGSDNQVVTEGFIVGSWSCSRESDITLSPGIRINGVAVTKDLLEAKSRVQEAFKRGVRSYQLYALPKALKGEPNIIHRHLLLLVSTAQRRDLNVENFLEIWSIFNESWVVGSYLLPRLSLQGENAIDAILSMIDTYDKAKAFLSLLEKKSEQTKVIKWITEKFEMPIDDARHAVNPEEENTDLAPATMDSEATVHTPLDIEPPTVVDNAELLEDFNLMEGDIGRQKILTLRDLSQLSVQDLVMILQRFGGDPARKEALKLILSKLSGSAKQNINKNVAAIVALFKSDTNRYDALEVLDRSQLCLQDMVAIMRAFDHDNWRVKALKLILSEPSISREDINNNVASIMEILNGKSTKLEVLELFDTSEISPEKTAQILEGCSGNYDRKSILEKIVKSLSLPAKQQLCKKRRIIINKFSSDEHKLDVMNLINK